MIDNFYAGNSLRLPLRFTRGADVMDITDYVIVFCMKANLTDSNDDAVILQEITDHIDAPNGLSEIFLTSDDTKDITAGKYFWEIFLRIDEEEAYTIRAGELKVLKGVYDV